MARSGVVTTNELEVSERDDSELERRWSFWRVAVPGGWLDNAVVEREAIIKALSHLPVVLSVAYDDRDSVLVLAPSGSEPPQAEVDGHGVVARRLSAAAISNRDLLRLVVNSCSRLVGDEGDDVNDTGRYLRLDRVPRPKGQMTAYEVIVTRSLSLSVPLRTFTKRKAVLDSYSEDSSATATRRLQRARRLPGFVRSASGTLVRSRDGARGDYIQMKTRWASEDRNQSKYAFVDVPEKGKPMPVTRVQVIDDLMVSLAGRLAGACTVRLRTYERIADVFRTSTDSLKSEVLGQAAGHGIRVTPAPRKGCAEAARALCKLMVESEAARGLDVAYGKRSEPDQNGWNIVVVPDEIGEKDGYEVYRNRVVQHVTVGMVTSLKGGPKEGETEKHRNWRERMERSNRNSVIGSLLKELRVKADVIGGRMSGPEWERLGPLLHEGVTCHQVVRVRMAKVEKQVKFAGLIDPSYRLCTLRADPSGRIAFESIGLDAAVSSPNLDLHKLAMSFCVLPDDGCKASVDTQSAILEFGESTVRVSSTDLFLLPNEMHDMLVGQANGLRARNKAQVERHLAPITGVAAFVRDGCVHYGVGFDTHFDGVVSRGVPVRRIDVVSGHDHTDAVVAMLDVGLSRYGRQTVVPYPLKYLREFAALEFGMVDQPALFDESVGVE